VTLIAGDVNRTKGESIKAKRIIIHPLFRYYPQQALLEHDIAIIQLAQPFNFNGMIKHYLLNLIRLKNLTV